MKYINIKFLRVIWQVLAEHIGNEVMGKICQDIIKYTKTNQKFSQYLIFALYNSFYKAQTIIASKCREELIIKSSITSYRGIITYKPPENDYNIKILENKIQSLAFQIKKNHTTQLRNQNKITLYNNFEKLLTQLSKLDDRLSEKTEYYLDKLIEEAEKDCDVNIYKTSLREKENGLGQTLHDVFFAEIEDKDELSNIFEFNLFAFKFNANLFAYEDINNIKTDDSKHHVLEKLDGKLFTTIEPIPIELGLSREKLGNEEKVAHDVQDNESCIKALKDLALNLSPEQFKQALEVAYDNESDLWRAKKLGELAPNLSPQLLEQTLKAACDIESELWRAKALEELAPHLSTKLLEQAFCTACDLKSELWRVKALSKLAPHLTPKLLEQALEVARGIKSEYNRTRALEELTPHLYSKK